MSLLKKIKNIIPSTSKHIKAHILDYRFKLPEKYTINIDKNFTVLDIKYSKDEIKRLQVLKDLQFLFEDYEEFDFEVLKEHQIIKDSIKYLENNYERLHKEGLQKREGIKDQDYSSYSSIRYNLLLLIYCTDYYLNIEDKDKKLLISLIVNLGNRNSSANYSETVMEMLEENDKKVQSLNSKKEKFSFAHKRYIYLPIIAHNETKKQYEKPYMQYVLEYYDALLEEDRTQSNMINLLRLKKVSSIGDIEDYADMLKSSVIQSIKDDIKSNLPKNIDDAREYLKKYLFYKFHNDITVFIDELLKIIDNISVKEDEVNLAVEDKKLYKAKLLSDELKVFYKIAKQYENKTILKDVDDRLSTYKYKISNASSYQEFKDAKSLCTDDKDIDEKEQNLIKQTIKDIESNFTDNPKENLFFLKNQPKNQPNQIIEFIQDSKKEFGDRFIKEILDKNEKLSDIYEQHKLIDESIDECKSLEINSKDLELKFSEVKNTIYEIEKKVKEIDSLINSKKLFEAYQKAETFKLDYHYLTKKVDEIYELALNELEKYKNSIDKVTTYEEFLKYKQCCIDDNAIDEKEQIFINQIIKEIESNFIDDVKENLSFLKNKLKNQPDKIVEYFKSIKDDFANKLSKKVLDSCDDIQSIEKQLKFIKNAIEEFEELDIKTQKLIDKQSDIKNIICTIDAKVDEIDSLINSKKLFEANQKVEILKNGYETITDKTDKIYEYAKKKLDIYIDSMSIAKTVEEFEVAKNLCIDDKEIKHKEDRFYNSILEDIKLIDDIALRYERLDISDRFKTEQEEILQKYAKRYIDKFYIDDIECSRKDEVSLMLSGGDINIDFTGLSSKNQLCFKLNGEKIDVTYKNKKQTSMGQYHYILNDGSYMDLTKIEFDKTYTKYMKTTIMIHYALMVDVEIQNQKLHFYFYINENENIKSKCNQLIEDKKTGKKVKIWDEIKLTQNNFLFFKDDKALEQYNIIKKNGYYFKNNKPIFERKVKV